MAHPATREYQDSLVQLRALTYRDTAELWPLLDLQQLDATWARFAAAMLQLISRRRLVAVGLARSYLTTLKGSPPTRVPNPELVVADVLLSLRLASVVSVKKAMTRKETLENASRNALVRSMGIADRYIGDGGRDLIRATVEADDDAQGWVRVTLGTCNYCRDQAAGNVMHEGGDHFPRHDHCGCQPEPVFTRNTGKWVRFYDDAGNEIGRVRAAEAAQISDLLDDALAVAPTVTRRDTGKWIRFYDDAGNEIGRVRAVEAAQARELLGAGSKTTAADFPPVAKDLAEVKTLWNGVRAKIVDPRGLDQNEGFLEYLMGGNGGYTAINGGLRGVSKLDEPISGFVRKMDEAFDTHGATLDKPMTVLRGSKLPEGVEYKPGSVVVDAGYTSTTVNPEVKNLGFFGDWSFDIKLPAGSKVLSPMDPSEREVILPRNSKFRVVAKDDETKKIWMELLP